MKRTFFDLSLTVSGSNTPATWCNIWYRVSDREFSTTVLVTHPWPLSEQRQRDKCTRRLELPRKGAAPVCGNVYAVVRRGRHLHLVGFSEHYHRLCFLAFGKIVCRDTVLMLVQLIASLGPFTFQFLVGGEKRAPTHNYHGSVRGHRSPGIYILGVVIMGEYMVPTTGAEGAVRRGSQSVTCQGQNGSRRGSIVCPEKRAVEEDGEERAGGTESTSPQQARCKVREQAHEGRNMAESHTRISRHRSHAHHPIQRHHHRISNVPTGSGKRSATDAGLNRMVLSPPVTKATLSELDVNKIVHNPKLRHDINFDPELHFRPNLDGEKGARKTEKADYFWHCMEEQLQAFLTHYATSSTKLDIDDWCLPATLRSIKGILETLVPERDRASVQEVFDVDQLMQQFAKGVADLENLALWLSQLLKSHCAPMRDEWVDDMVAQLSNGHRNHDIPLLVGGMRTLLGVLEAMKLVGLDSLPSGMCTNVYPQDVANHQIRCLRPLLIEDTVQFEQKFFMKKIALSQLDVTGAHAWFRASERAYQEAQPDVSGGAQGGMWVFLRGLLDLTTPSRASQRAPATFKFDEERIMKLRSEMLDAINLEVCLGVYQDLIAQARTSAASAAAMAIPTYHLSDPASSPHGFSSPTLPNTADFMRHQKNAPLTMQTRAVIRNAFPSPQVWFGDAYRDSDAASTSTTPPSLSNSTSASASPTLSATITPGFTSPTPSELRSSLTALLSSSPTTSWPQSTPSLALQILRSTPLPLTHLPDLEAHLATHLGNPSSALYAAAEARVVSTIWADHLVPCATDFAVLTTGAMFEAATGSRRAPGSVAAPGARAVTAGERELRQLGVRIAHLGVLHWRVWAPLAYQVDPDEE